MPIALDNPSRNLSDSRITSNRPIPSKSETRAAANRLTKLLTSAPIDLSGISDEIRRHPDLESLILGPDVSLAQSPDEPLGTIEEAVVVLGTSRLRTLIDQWSSNDSVNVRLLHTQNEPSS